MSSPPLAAPPPGSTLSLAGWGRYPVEECVAYRPERLEELRSLNVEELTPLEALQKLFHLKNLLI